MIKLPDFDRAFEYENNFYLSCDVSRIGKILAHYELYKMASNVPGAIVECGVFKGASLARFAMFRDLFGNPFSKKIIAFDTFSKFPDTAFVQDKLLRNKFIQTAGEESISIQQMNKVLKNKKIDKFIELIEGDIVKTIPNYVESHPELRISILNLDVDIYEPSVTVLEYLYPKITGEEFSYLMTMELFLVKQKQLRITLKEKM